MLNAELRALLVCPVDHQPLRDDDAALICTACARRYPIIEGIPMMVVEDTEPSHEAQAT